MEALLLSRTSAPIEQMKVLPQGVTGFRHAEEPPLSEISIRSLETACWEAARRLHGSVLSTRPAGIATNFHTFEISLPEQKVSILCNAHFPLIGFAEPIAPGQQVFSFVDVSGLAAVLKSIGGLEVLTAGELKSPLVQESISDLSPAELKQVAYWRPQTVGEVIFNCWD